MAFVAGSKQEFDVIMMSTGYETFDFSPELFAQKSFHNQYKHILGNSDPTLAFIAFVCPVLGTVPVLGEIQSRYVTKIYSGRVQLKFK